MTQRPIDHKYEPREIDTTSLDSDGPESILRCKTCGLTESAHGDLADHPDEKRLREAEVAGATTLASLARRAARALREHRRVDAVVLLTQLTVVANSQRQGMVRAINDQMDANSDC